MLGREEVVTLAREGRRGREEDLPRAMEGRWAGLCHLVMGVSELDELTK